MDVNPLYLVSATVGPWLVVAGLRLLNLQLGKHERWAFLNPFIASALSLAVQLLMAVQQNVELSPASMAVVAVAVAGLNEHLQGGKTLVYGKREQK